MTDAPVPPPAPREHLTIGISASALFDMREADEVFRTKGKVAYESYMLAKADEPLPKGTGWPLVEKLLRFNSRFERTLDVVIMSRNNPLSAIRLQNSLRHHGLIHDATRDKISDFALTGGKPLAPFLKPYKIDLFLSTDAADVQAAIDQNVAAALLSPVPKGALPDPAKLHLCFDFDGVLADADSDRFWMELAAKNKTMSFDEQLARFYERETALRDTPLEDGPFAPVLRKLARLRRELPKEILPVEITILTARANVPLERALKTLRSWDVDPDALLSAGQKNPEHAIKQVLKADIVATLRPDLFLDDTHRHVDLAAIVAPAGKVPWPQKPGGQPPGPKI